MNYAVRLRLVMDVTPYTEKFHNWYGIFIPTSTVPTILNSSCKIREVGGRQTDTRCTALLNTLICYQLLVY